MEDVDDEDWVTIRAGRDEIFTVIVNSGSVDGETKAKDKLIFSTSRLDFCSSYHFGKFLEAKIEKQIQDSTDESQPPSNS
jgi:hypothetical protein